MVDGHTEEGSYKVILELTGDEVDQAIRSLNWALMMDSHEDKPPDYPQRLDVMAHRAFIKGMVAKYEQAKEQQRPR